MGPKVILYAIAAEHSPLRLFFIDAWVEKTKIFCE